MTDAAPAPMPPMTPAAPDGKTLGIVALIAAFLFALLGLILGLVARGQSKRAGVSNTPAKAAIVLSIIFLVIQVIAIIVVIATGGALFGGLASQCAQYGPGVHELPNGVTLTCG